MKWLTSSELSHQIDGFSFLRLRELLADGIQLLLGEGAWGFGGWVGIDFKHNGAIYYI